MRAKNLKSKSNALTVIEMLIAIGILITILGIIILTFKGSQEASRDSIRLKDAQEIINTLEDYYLKCNFNDYPIIGSRTDCDAGGLPRIAKSNDSSWAVLQQNILSDSNIKRTLPTDPFSNVEGKKDIYYYTYCVANDGCHPEKYVLMIRLETKNTTAVEGGYKGKFPSGTDNICDCTNSGTETGPPYLYCIKSP